jgi:hypothetical protein
VVGVQAPEAGNKAAQEVGKSPTFFIQEGLKMAKFLKNAIVVHTRYKKGTVLACIPMVVKNEVTRNTYIVMFDEYGRLTVSEKDLKDYGL